jgi:MFS family permease
MAVEASVETPAPDNAITRALRDTAGSVRSVFRHRALRRIQLALAGSMIGDWAYATAVVVWAYGVGGAKAVGIWSASRYVLMSLTAPFAAGLADRLPRKQVMIASDLIRCLFVVVAAICIAGGTPSAPIYILATLVAMLGSVFRPAQMAIMPSLADEPEQLTASNGLSSTVESLAFFVGPALGAALVAATDVQTVFYVNAATFLWSAALVAPIRPRVAESDGGEDGDGGGALAQMLAGFAEIRHSRDLLLVVYLVCAQTIVAGASTVYTVLWAVGILDTGARGVGYVTAVFGIGALLGGFFALSRVSRNKLAADLAVGVALWSVPLLLVVAWPSPFAVFAASIVMGFANPLVDVNFVTVIQRITPDRVLGRVFGAFEGAVIGTMALGAAVMPFLVEWLGLRPALTVIALVVGAPIPLLIPLIRGLDRRTREPDGLALLRRLPIFRPLGPTALDSLARQLNRVPVAAGTVVVTEGDIADRFYVIESGRVAVTHGAQFVRHEGPGDYFGEIGLLRDVPRTATVTADQDAVLYSLGRTEFLDAIGGSLESASALEDVVSYRLRY